MNSNDNGRHDVRITGLDIPFKDVLVTTAKFLGASLFLYLLFLVPILMLGLLLATE